MAWFLCCVFLCCSGGFQFRSKPDPLGAHHPPCQQPAAGEGAPREGARRPKQPPRQDQTWQSPCSRPGTGEGKLAGGRRPSWRGCGEPRWLRRASSSYPLPGSGQTERAWGTAGLGRQPVGGDSGVAPGAQKRGPPTAHALDPGLGLSGPARAAACLGKSRPSSRRHGPARQSGGGDSRNLPGDRWRVTRHYEPRYGQCFRCVSGESPGARGWAGLRLRTVRFSPKRRHGPWW